MFYFYILAIFWFIRTFKSLLFWLYLWQLKEYHLGRFLAHFQTEKGGGLLLNKYLVLKLLLFFGFFLCLFYLPPSLEPGEIRLPVEPPLYEIWLKFFSSFALIFLLLLYFGESYLVVKNFFQKKLKIPILTQKTTLLILAGLFFQILFLFVFFQNYYLIKFTIGLLAFDILMPIIASIIVFSFQPLTVLLRNQIIKRAKAKREQFKGLLVIGIAGSYGKTSTKEFLTTILETKFRVLKTKENHNSEIGISQCILQELKPEHKIFICEMAAYNKGGIKLLCDIVKPKIGIITGVNEQHLATFGSMENLLSAEGGKELVDSLPKDGIAFLNVKNKHCQEMYKKLVALRPQQSLLKSEVNKVNEVNRYGEDASFAGGENILGAMAVAKELGMSEQEISKSAEKIKNKFPGIEIKKGIDGLSIINATYSANPTGAIAHLDYLKNWSGKKIIIMPCLIELGSASKRVHQEIGKKIGEICDLAIITTKDRFNEIKQGATKQGMQEKDVLFLENPRLIKQKLKESLAVSDTAKLGGIRYRQNRYRQNSVVLLEGRISKQIVELIKKL